MPPKPNTTEEELLEKFRGVFGNMNYRCYNKKSGTYRNYGARGIIVEWKSFEEFKKDMFEDYLKHCEEFGQRNTTIDRINNDGNYSKENCRWATRQVQARNMSTTRYVPLIDVEIGLGVNDASFREWEDRHGIVGAIKKAVSVVNYINIAQHSIECGHCHPEKGYELVEKYGLKCDCRCHFEDWEARFDEMTKPWHSQSLEGLDLTEKELTIVNARKNNKTREEISKEFGVTREAIRQTEDKIKEKIKVKTYIKNFIREANSSAKQEEVQRIIELAEKMKSKDYYSPNFLTRITQGEMEDHLLINDLITTLKAYGK